MKLFVWDFHGTLEKDNENAVLEISNKVLEKLGFKERLTKKDNLKLYGKKWYQYFEYLLPNESYKTHFFIQQKGIEYETDHPQIIDKHIKPNDHALDILEKIAKSDHHQILVSNMSDVALIRFMKSIKIVKFFPKNSAFATNSYKKKITLTKKDILTKYLKGKKFDKVITIGDTEIDIEMGRAVGATTYLYAHPGKKFAKTDADYKIRDLKEILKEL